MLGDCQSDRHSKNVARHRRVSRLDHNTSDGSKSQWFFYYDLEDRMIEVKYKPIVASPSNYTIYQFYWLGKRPVAYFGTTYPAGTTGRFFIHADDANRPLEMMDWPISGDAAIVYAINPDVFGWDRVLFSPTGIYQPFRLNGAYFEYGTQAIKASGPTIWHRPALLTSGGVTFDPLTETFLQRIGEWPNEPYSHEAHDPTVGFNVEKTEGTVSSSCPIERRPTGETRYDEPSSNVLRLAQEAEYQPATQTANAIPVAPNCCQTASGVANAINYNSVGGMLNAIYQRRLQVQQPVRCWGEHTVSLDMHIRSEAGLNEDWCGCGSHPEQREEIRNAA